MRLTTRYITKNILMSALFVLLILLAVIWLTQSLRFLELIVNSNAPVSLFMKMIALSLPRFPEIIIPVALVAAVIFSYNRMMMDSEIVVMRSAGISPRRLAVPALVVAGLSVFVMLLFSAWLSPAARAEMQDLRQVIRAEFSTFLLKEGVFNPVGDDLVIYLRERRRGGELHGLLVHDTRPENRTPVTITARRGILVTAEDEPAVIVYDGSRQQFDPATGSLSKLEFSEYTLEIQNFKEQVGRRFRDVDERSLLEILTLDYDSSENLRGRKHEFMVEAHKRIIMPFSAFGLTLVTLACLLTGSFNRRGQVRRIITAVTLVFLMQAVYLGLINTAKDALWAIPALYAAVILPIFAAWFVLGDSGYALLNRLRKKHKIPPAVPEDTGGQTV